MSNESKIETPNEKPFFKDKSDAGKGDRPRNVSRAYWDNYDSIDWNRNKNIQREYQFIRKFK